MKHPVLYRIYSLILVLLLCFSLSGCGNNIPPKREAVESHFWDNWSEIQTVVDYMVDSGYEDFYIMDASGEATADLGRPTSIISRVVTMTPAWAYSSMMTPLL